MTGNKLVSGRVSLKWCGIIRSFFFNVTLLFIFYFLNQDSNLQASFLISCAAQPQPQSSRQVCLTARLPCSMHGWAAKKAMSHDDQGQSTGLSKPGRISGSGNSTLLDWGAQSGECWSARPGWEWWLLVHGCPKPLKCSTSPQEAFWHSSLHFLNQSWVIRAATGKRTDQTIIPPHPPLYPFDMWQSRKSAALDLFFFFAFLNRL